MSGTSDYTLTANLSLFKPTPMADLNAWGTHLNANADTLDALLGTSGAAPGPWLPLDGGTLTGNTVFSGGFSSSYPSTANQLVSAPTHPSASYVDGQSQLFSYYIAAAAGGTSGQVSANGQFYSSITGAPNQYIFNLLAVADYSGTGGNAQLVPIYGQGLRRSHNTGGAANNPEIWAGVFECVDFTNTDSALTNYMSGIEVDITCGNTDSAGTRRGIGLYLNTVAGGTAPVCGLGVHIAANSGTYNTMLKLQAQFNIAAIDLRSAEATSGSAYDIWLATAGAIAMDSNPSLVLTSDGTGGLVMTGAASQPSRITYKPGSGVNVWWAGAWSDGSFYINGAGTNFLAITPNGNLHLTNSFAVNGATPPGKPTLSGAKGSNAALASVIAALVAYGMATDSTTA